MKKQAHIFYSGIVQGIGFRFSAENLAHKLGVSGWVKNLDDGRVEVLAESEEEILKEFISRIRDEFSPYIRNVDIQWMDAENRLDSFSIEF